MPDYLRLAAYINQACRLLFQEIFRLFYRLIFILLPFSVHPRKLLLKHAGMGKKQNVLLLDGSYDLFCHKCLATTLRRLK